MPTTTTAGIVLSPPSYSEQLCDHQLEVAEIAPRWQPSGVPEVLRGLSGPVFDLGSPPELAEDDIGPAAAQAQLIAQEANGLFEQIHPMPAPWRTTQAIEQEIGNCIAGHEAVNGLQRTIGLSALSIGMWDRRYSHASSGMVVPGRRLEIDGYNATSDLYEEEVFDQAWQDAITHQQVVDVQRTEDGLATQAFDIVDLHTLSIEKTQGRRWLVMPGATMVLMFAGVQARISGDKHAQAILKPFTPVG